MEINVIVGAVVVYVLALTVWAWWRDRTFRRETLPLLVAMLKAQQREWDEMTECPACLALESPRRPHPCRSEVTA